MTTFVVHGPFDLPFEKRPGGRTLSFDAFWSENSSAAYLSAERGCYVFAIQAKALTPIYVGKATKTFKQETFNPSNRHKYSQRIQRLRQGQTRHVLRRTPEAEGKDQLKADRSN
jgi:hypothetical protein